MVATAVAATMLALASVAYACTVVATVDLDKAAATPGTQVNGTGKSFSQSPLSSAVDVHFNSLDGNVVWSGRAASDGQVAFSFKVPEGMAPGQYTIVATQRDAQGRAESGTPARSTLRVVAPDTAAAPAAPAAPAPDTARPDREPARAQRPEPSRSERGSARGGDTAGRPDATPAPAAMPTPQRAAAPTSTPARAERPASRPAQSSRPAPRSGERGATASRPDRSPARPERAAPAPQTEAVASAPASKSDPGGSSLFALLFVGGGILLSVVAGAMILAGRRSDKGALARLRR